MKSLFLFFAVFLLCTSSVFAYPEKCFVIKVNGDTIHGIFEFRDKEITPQLLKISTESGEKEFLPADIRIFVSQKVVYVSRNVEVPAQKASVLDISTPSFTTKFENCFLELLVSGEKDLLLLNTEQIGSFFYCNDENETISLLIHKKFYKVIRGEGKLIENDTYKRQLDNFFDCAELAEKIRDTPYKILSMLNLFNVYYATCLKKKPEFTRTESYKTDFYFGLSGRGTLIYISAKKFPTLNYSSETSFLTFSGGGYFTLEAVSRKNLGKRSFYSEFGVFGYQINSTSVEEYMNKPDTKTINLGLLYARSGHFLRFMSKNKNGIRTYFGVGVMLGLVLSSDFSYVNTYTSLSRPMTVRYSGKRFFEPKEFEMGFGLQFGVRSRRFCAELRTDYGDGFSPFVVVRTHTFYGSATVGVIF